MIKQSLTEYVKEYTAQLKKGQIQKAYKGIMAFMSGLKTYLENNHPQYASSALYFGYMDMTYFAFTPPEMKKRNLKIAIVYLHEQNQFELWLGGNNRKVQAEYIEMLRHKKIGEYQLSHVSPGVDSILSWQLVERPDFDRSDDLMRLIEGKTIEFAQNIQLMIGE